MIRKNYTYKVIVPPANKPVSLETVKQQLRIDNNDSDDLLNLYIDAATQYVEDFTSRILITRTFETYRDYFPCVYNRYNNGFELRRSPLQSVISIQYLYNKVLQTVDDNIYYNTLESDYSKILLYCEESWPQDIDKRLQSITITFVAGYGDDESFIPSDFKNIILQIVTELYENRGDCSGSGCSQFVPAAAKAMLLQNRIMKL